MYNQDSIIYIHTDEVEPLQIQSDLFEGRKRIAEIQQQHLKKPEVSIAILGYNRLEKTKRCVESVLKHTKGIDYELILIDNGSVDDTLEYFKQVPYEKKHIIRITKGMGTNYAWCWLSCVDIGPYFVFLANDLVCTPNWLHNLLICIKSDEKIGMVNPVSSNVSNGQQVDLPFSNLEEMEWLAENYNQSDARKWEEKLRLITLGSLYRKEALLSIGFPIFDIGFFHDFGDDDLSFRIRRNGYRLILAKDTWIHHDHDFRNYENKTPEEYHASVNIGRENFREKYHGIDAWEDIYLDWEGSIRSIPLPILKREVTVLGLDVKCGSSLLEIKNYLTANGISEINLNAFVQDSKYREDLCSICNGTVVCDREDGIRFHFPRESYDYIILGRSINTYTEPWVVLQDLMDCLKQGGVLILSLENTMSYLEFLNMLGVRRKYREEIVYHIPYEMLVKQLQYYGEIIHAEICQMNVSKEDRESLQNLWKNPYGIETKEENFARFMAKNFVVMVRKS